MYLGQDGDIICTAGCIRRECVEGAGTVPQRQVSVNHFCPRAGHIGLLHWDQQTTMVKMLAAQVPPNLNAFSYDASAVLQDLATWAYVQDCGVVQFVALVLLVLMAEYNWPDGAEDPYAVVCGKDTDGGATRALHLWRLDGGDVQQGCIYTIRGLKVYKYVPRDDGSWTVECCWQTALEYITPG